MEKQTLSRIQKEIDSLVAIKPKTLRTSAFGDDHHAAIDAQVLVLQRRMEEEDIYEEFGTAADNIRDEALAARMWIDGEYEDYPDLVSQWKELARK